jgi:hypothetical protein
MAAAPAFAPQAQPGGGLFQSPIPLWYPPLSAKWIATGLVVFAGAVVNKMEAKWRAPFATPLGFFLTAVAAVAMFEYGFPPAAFALLFFLLMAWSTQHAAETFVGSAGRSEGFLNPSAVDFVDNGQRKWFVEKVLKENPVGIQEKDVATYPVQGASAQAGTSAGNT